MTKNWVPERPTNPGHYWFYGWLDLGDLNDGREPKLSLVKVVKISNGTTSFMDGHFMFDYTRLVGLFRPIDWPVLPPIRAFAALLVFWKRLNGST